MGIFEAALLCLILWRVSEVDAQGDQWKTATATYSKEKDGTMSISTDGACGYGEIHTASSYGKYSAGLSTMLFNRGSACGACFEVRCVNHILWCLQGSPSVILTATDFCPPNSGLSADYGGWCNFPMARNWGQFWQCNVDLKSQPLSFEVTVSSGKTLASYNVAPANWRFGQTYEGKQFTV